MSIHNAKKFIVRGMAEPSLRDRLNDAATIDGLNRTLTQQGLSFTPGEFEEAYSNRLTQCQFEEQADQLREFRMWWDLLHQFVACNPGESSGICTTGSPCPSRSSCGSCHG